MTQQSVNSSNEMATRPYYDDSSERFRKPPSIPELAMDYIKDYAEYKRVLQECNATIHNTNYPNDGIPSVNVSGTPKKVRETYCNATWDTMQCWGYTPAGSTVYQPCPAYIDLSNPMAYSRKTCNSDGTWFQHPDSQRVWTNYSMCYNEELVNEHKQVLYMYYYGFGISIVLCAISFIILTCFRQLNCVRVTLHKHLFVSYVLTGAMWILYYRLVPMDPEVLMHNALWCRVLHVLTHYMTVCNYAWMFCEGFYLNAVIVITFIKDKKLLYVCCVIGWVVPIIPAVIYTAVRSSADGMETERCWTGESHLYWIFAGPINASLFVNFIFSINIMRILLSKLRSVHNNETMQTRRAVRATLILIPLLGLQYMAFPFKPEHGSDGDYIYSMILAFVVSFQGVFVALVFCFFNGEVISVIKKKISRLRRNQFHHGSTRTTKQWAEDGMGLTTGTDIQKSIHEKRKPTTTENNSMETSHLMEAKT